jgi:hypothetical protein
MQHILPVRPHGLHRATIVAIVLFTLAEASARAEEDAPPPTAPEQGFESLLQGDGTSQWVGYGMDKWPLGWEVDATNGILHRKGSGGDLRTIKKYRDFDLRFDWKISRGGNSGVMYRAAQEDEYPAYRTGPEYQLLDDDRHKDGKNSLTSTSALYGLYAPSEKMAKPVGQWNHARIVLRGNHVQHFLNGKKVVDCEMNSDDWNARVAKSKFAELKQFGKLPEGHIIVQDHGDEVWYQNIRIKELN